MMRSLFSAISGLRNHMTYMDVIGNNIANVNTIAFKASRVTFLDVLGQTIRGATAPQNDLGGTNPLQVGLGMRLGSIDTMQMQGSLQSTGRVTDFAIQGDGYFILNNGSRDFYTRDGAFDVALDGALVSPSSGYKVQGWTATSGTINTDAPIGDIAIPFGSTMAANPTGELGLSGNLDANTALGSAVSTSVNVYDSLGNLNTVRMSFTRTAAGTWTVTDSLPSTLTATLGGAGTDIASISGTPTGDLRPGVYTITTDASGNVTSAFLPDGATTAETATTGTITAGGTNTTLIPGVTLTAAGALAGGTQTITIAGGTAVTFDSGGAYDATNPALSLTLTHTNGADTPQTVQLDLTGMTSFAGSGSVTTTSQDGFTAGSLVTFSVSQSGEITGVFSNGSNQKLGQIALALFTNPGGLSKAGNNLLENSTNSGEPTVGAANTGGRGVVSSGVLEGSNVDLAQEFTNVIIAQRGFQASSRVITASDELLRDLVNIGR